VKIIKVPGHYTLLGETDNSLEDTNQFSAIIMGDFFIKCDDQSNNVKKCEDRFGEKLKKLIKSSDVSIVNLESPITDSQCSIKKSGPSLKMSPQIVDVLKYIGITGLTLANNHIMDYGTQGLVDTLNYTSDNGLKTCGAGIDITNAINPMVFHTQTGLKIALFSFCEQEFGIASKNTMGSACVSSPFAVEKISIIKKEVDFILVINHGGLENVPFFPSERKLQMRNLIDAGADLVIGHHPHVPQGWVKDKGKFIFYSLGNLIFNFPAIRQDPNSNWGFIVRLVLDVAGKKKIDIILTEQKNGVVEILDDDELKFHRIKYLDFISNIISNDELFEKYWQSLAIRIYNKRYLPRFKHIFCSNIMIQTLQFLRSFKLYRKNERNNNELVLLNLIQNESHSWTIKKALNIISGNETDLRSPDIEKEMDLLKKF